MISAQADTVAQEQLIEKYMLLPNQVWDDIISQASKVRRVIHLKFFYLREKITHFSRMCKYIFEKIINIYSFLLECGCLEGPRSSKTTRQHLKNKC